MKKEPLLEEPVATRPSTETNGSSQEPEAIVHFIWSLSPEELVSQAGESLDNIDNIADLAIREFLQDCSALQSPRASRRELGSYMKACRESCKLSVEQIVSSTMFPSYDVHAVENGKSPIFSIVKDSEHKLFIWVKEINADPRRVARFLRNCPSPADWQTNVKQSEDELTYHPASTSSQQETATVVTVPQVDAIVDRFLESMYR